MFLLYVFFPAFFASYLTVKKIIPKLIVAGMVGKDMHKENKPEIAEMGGIAIVIGFIGASLVGIVMHSFFGFEFELAGMLSALLTISIVTIIGIFDDIFDIGQWVKAVLPLAAAIPMIAIELAGANNIISIPFVGAIDFGLVYPLLLVPLAIAVCSNLTNMLAGYNGLETGLGIIIFSTLSILAITSGQTEMAILTIAMLGALLGVVIFNWYPAKIFIGDVGTFSIGAALAVSVILSDLKSAGAILAIPFIIDFLIKAINRFPKSFARVSKNKLYAPKKRIRGLADLILKLNGGMSEKKLVMSILFIEVVFALVALVLYLKV